MFANTLKKKKKADNNGGTMLQHSGEQKIMVRL